MNITDIQDLQTRDYALRGQFKLLKRLHIVDLEELLLKVQELSAAYSAIEPSTVDSRTYAKMWLLRIQTIRDQIAQKRKRNRHSSAKRTLDAVRNGVALGRALEQRDAGLTPRQVANRLVATSAQSTRDAANAASAKRRTIDATAPNGVVTVDGRVLYGAAAAGYNPRALTAAKHISYVKQHVPEDQEFIEGLKSGAITLPTVELPPDELPANIVIVPAATAPKAAITKVSTSNSRIDAEQELIKLLELAEKGKRQL